MKQFNQKITATASAILIAVALVGLNTDRAIAQGKARKGAKVRAGGNARIAPTPGSSKNAGPALFSTNNVSALQNSENVRSQSERKTVAGAEAFTVDMGTSEKVRLQTERTRRKTTKRTRQ